MRITIPPILVQMQMNDRQIAFESIDKAEIIIPGRAAEICMSEIQAHAKMLSRNRVQFAQAREKFVELFRRMLRRVLYRKLQTCLSGLSNQRRNCVDKPLNSRLMIQMNI